MYISKTDVNPSIFEFILYGVLIFSSKRLMISVTVPINKKAISIEKQNLNIFIGIEKNLESLTIFSLF